MKYVRALTLVVLCAAATQVSAGMATTYGTGVESCGKWLASSNELTTRAWAVSWVLGFLTAAGVYDVRGELRKTDSDAIAAWVDNYCRDKPLDHIADAATALVDALATPSVRK
jgi:hypothetical protein